MDVPLHVSVNEFFGPTYQGEGPAIGWPCYFLRLHHCPVKCPGCDTAYTWDGSEQATRTPLAEVEALLGRFRSEHPACGLVLTGGEPLLYARRPEFIELLKAANFPWMQLETSGYMGAPLGLEGYDRLSDFLHLFNFISISPKVTPCLHGGKPDNELELHIPLLLSMRGISTFSFKYVVRDLEDITAAVDSCRRLNILPVTHISTTLHTVVYLMPYGNDRDEILKTTELILPACASFGFAVSPRLQALLWGKNRAH